MKKVLEIKITDESPLKKKCLNEVLGEIPQKEDDNSSSELPLKIGMMKLAITTKDVTRIEIENSPTFDREAGCFKALKFTTLQDKSIEKIMQAFNEPKTSEISPIEKSKQKIKNLEELVIAKKEYYSERYMQSYRNLQECKKILERNKKETQISVQDLSKMYSKRILDLRKEENLLKTELFNIKARVYTLELEIDSICKDIEDVNKDFLTLESEKQKIHTAHDQIIHDLNKHIEDLRHENFSLSHSSLELIKQAEELIKF
ncbi:hypothetical protein SteCoe_26377 [Stentor coeruleus]|uniref:Uncharacterized protein n=1 Tax=Stentor coeruleus TaxID=5963 RepID=A0A1R2BCZ1_9CILI|nr:hypothetical protein SteCoe_26377 [Stentor coeruleus]